MRHEFEVKAPDAGRRLDRFVQSVLGGVPVSLVQRLLRQKKVRVNDVRGRADQRLQSGDTVVVHHALQSAPAPSTGRPPRVYAGPPIEVLRASNDFLFVAKPAGVSCSDDGQDPAALALWIEEYLGESIAHGEVRPQPCHRLDRGTTGVVAVALTVAAFDRFRAALASGTVRKEYEVAVWGTPVPQRWTCELPLVRREHVTAGEPRVVPADPDDQVHGRAWTASTEFELVVQGAGAALLRALPRTGRTHQIRAHCLASGLPVIGDPRYGAPQKDAFGGSGARHPLLHARRLRLHDAIGTIDVGAAWPSAEATLLRGLGLLPR